MGPARRDICESTNHGQEMRMLFFFPLFHWTLVLVSSRVTHLQDHSKCNITRGLKLHPRFDPPEG